MLFDLRVISEKFQDACNGMPFTYKSYQITKAQTLQSETNCDQ